MAAIKNTLSFEEAYNNAMQFCNSFGMLTKLMPQVLAVLQREAAANGVTTEVVESVKNEGGPGLRSAPSELDKKDKLNTEEIIGTSCNFVLGVGHKKCGCPGFVAMRFHDNCWICPRCNGWISKDEAKKIMKKRLQ